jgi:hypothetical protein
MKSASNNGFQPTLLRNAAEPERYVVIQSGLPLPSPLPELIAFRLMPRNPFSSFLFNSVSFLIPGQSAHLMFTQ